MSTIVGTVVLYTLSNVDALEVNRRRDDWRAHVRSGALRDFTAATGYQAHVGSTVYAGNTLPAVVVSDADGYLNLRVLLDGTDDLWATMRTEGDPGQPGTWAYREAAADEDVPVPYTLPYEPAPDPEPAPRPAARKAAAKKAAAK